MKGKLWLLLFTVLLASDSGANKDDWTINHPRPAGKNKENWLLNHPRPAAGNKENWLINHPRPAGGNKENWLLNHPRHYAAGGNKENWLINHPQNKDTRKHNKTRPWEQQLFHPELRRKPTVAHPLFFFHIPKTGGMTLRLEIIQIFGHADYFIPCFNMSCKVGTALNKKHTVLGEEYLPKSRCATIFAGHFKPGVLMQGLLEIDRGVHGAENVCSRGSRGFSWATKTPPISALDQVDCIIGARDPISRAISLWNYEKRTGRIVENRSVSDFIDDKGVNSLLRNGNSVVTFLSTGFLTQNYANPTDVALAVYRRCHVYFPDTKPEEVTSWLADTAMIKDVNTNAQNVAKGHGGEDNLRKDQIDKFLRHHNVQADGAVYAAIREDYGLSPCTPDVCYNHTLNFSTHNTHRIV